VRRLHKSKSCPKESSGREGEGEGTKIGGKTVRGSARLIEFRNKKHPSWGNRGQNLELGTVSKRGEVGRFCMRVLLGSKHTFWGGRPGIGWRRGAKWRAWSRDRWRKKSSGLRTQRRKDIVRKEQLKEWEIGKEKKWNHRSPLIKGRVENHPQELRRRNRGRR